MNKRLLAYLRKLGLATTATNQEAVGFFQGLRGDQLAVANLLNYNEDDTVAAERANIGIRAFGYDPDQPESKLTAAPTASDPVASGRSLTEADVTIISQSAAPLQPIEAGSGQRSASSVGTDGASLVDSQQFVNQGAEQERARVRSIHELGSLVGATEEQIRSAVDGNQTFDQVRSAWYQERQNQQTGVQPELGAPAGHSRNSVTDFSRQSLVNALVCRFGGHVGDPLNHIRTYNPLIGQFSRSLEDLTPEHRQAVDRGYELSGLSVIEIARRALQLDGIQCDPTVGSVMAGMGRAATMSTSNFTGVFTQAYGAMMLASYDEAEDESLAFTRVGKVSNYFKQERDRMGKMGALSKHAKGGVADNMAGSDSKAYVKADSYTGKFTIDRQDLINDTFGLLSDYTAEEMGESAKSLRPDLVFAILLANSNMDDGNALFSAAHNNIATGGLTHAGLDQAFGLFGLQQENGKTLNLRGKHVIVPLTKAVTASEQVNSTLMVGQGGGDNDRAPNLNGIASLGFNVVPSARLDSGVTDPDTEIRYAGDNTKSFVATDRGKGGIQVSYVAGLPQGPEVRSRILPAGSGQWGIEIDVELSIGADELDYRGLVRIDE